MNTYNKDEVVEIEKTLGGKPKWFVGRMVCSKCNTERLVRYDVYLKRILRAKEVGVNEEDMHRTYVCQKCSGGRSIKKAAFLKMLNEKKDKK